MTWIKLDDTLPNNPKILPLSDKAFRLYIEGLCYANQYLTDGFLAQAVVNRLDNGNACQELIDAGLWVQIQSQIQSGIQIHDYCEHQTSRKVVEEKREQVRNRVTRYREKSNAVVTTPETETETETETDKRKDMFDDFWKIYPLKVGKGAALKAFLKAVRTTDADIIIKGAERYKLDPNRSQGYTAHAATWLNAHRWLDEALPTRNLSPAEIKEKELHEARIKSEREKEEAAKWFKEQEEIRRNAVPPPAELRELLRKSFTK
jgi:hypothetical protein